MTRKALVKYHEKIYAFRKSHTIEQTAFKYGLAPFSIWRLCKKYKEKYDRAV